MTFGSLFAGIGGFDVGLERAGMVCKWQVEIDKYARRVLEKHWPDVRRWREVHMFPPDPIDDWKADLVCGGFPCQPTSDAGHKRGTTDIRWLWPAMAHVVAVLNPRYVLVENVPGLLVRGLADVLRDLARLGYDAEWDHLPASAFGASHRRYRLFLLAYPKGERDGRDKVFTGAIGERIPEAVASWPRGQRLGQRDGGRIRVFPCTGGFGMDDGPTNELDRLRCLGNAVVPQVAEWIGKRIMEATS